MMTYQVHLKNVRKPNQPKLSRFDVEKLRDPDVACTFQANTAASCEILGKELRKKKLWVTRDVFDLCDEKRDLKKWYKAEEAKEYREANKGIQKAGKKANEDWIGARWVEMKLA